MHKKTTTVCFNLRYIHKFTDHVHHQKKLADLQIIVMCNVAINYCCMFFLRKSADQMEIIHCTQQVLLNSWQMTIIFLFFFLTSCAVIYSEKIYWYEWQLCSQWHPQDKEDQHWWAVHNELHCKSTPHSFLQNIIVWDTENCIQCKCSYM